MVSALKKWRTAVLVFLTHRVALPLLKRVRKPNRFTCDKEQLARLPEGTLGNDLYRFLDQRGLPFLDHYARHDLKHVLLQYDTTGEGEACLQCFMLGNGRVSFPVLATVGYALLTMPEHWKKMYRSYRRGRRSTSFHHWPWNELLATSTAALRQRIFNPQKERE